LYVQAISLYLFLIGSAKAKTLFGKILL